MKYENKEIFAGAILVSLLIGVLSFVHSRAALEKGDSSFILYAPFNKTDGLMNGADVRVSGIKMGRVVEQTMNNHYQVRVKMAFFMPVELSSDSAAIIETDGLLGSKYLELIPGGDDKVLKSGDELIYTQDAVVLSELMNKVNDYMREKKNIGEQEAQ